MVIKIVYKNKRPNGRKTFKIIKNKNDYKSNSFYKGFNGL